MWTVIKFFRHIRQRLLAESKFSKYVVYAIGEIVLVVIGILIALQINNWNEKRKLAAYEEILLSQLRQDLKRNVEDLELNISLQQKTIRSTDILLRHMQTKRPYHDSLETHFANVGLWTKFIVNAGAYKTIESRGLDMISNVKLRDLVFRIYEGNHNWLRQMEGVVINHTENFRQQYASLYFKEWNPVQIVEGRYEEGTAKLIDYNRFLEGEGATFRYFLSASKGETEVLLHISKGFLDDNKQGIALIDSQLKAAGYD
mgnify:CR=1 FL=1